MLAAHTLAALSLLAAAPEPLPEIPFDKYTLDNGLTVILHHDPRLPLVAVSVWYDVGGLHERPGRSGFAHLFEHMMFQGSVNVGEDRHFPYLQAAGATGVNGTTSFDRTNYFETIPRNYLELALWLESDRMGFLLPALSKKSLDNQIEVVKNERRQSLENRPYGIMGEKIVQTLYAKPHPYHGNVIGSMKDLNAATVDDVRDFFMTYYTPANATLCIAGDFDPKAIKGLVDKYFGPIKGRPKPPAVNIPAPKLEADVRIDFVEKVGRLAKLHMVWMGPSAFQPGTADLDLLAYVISGTKSSRLDRRVSYEDQIAQSVTAYFEEHRSGGQFNIEIVVRPDRTVAEAEAAVNEVLAGLKTNPITEAELARAKNAYETRLFRGLERLGGFSGRAELLQRYNLLLGDPGKLGWDISRYRDATLDSVNQAFTKYLSAPRLVVDAKPASGGAR